MHNSSNSDNQNPAGSPDKMPKDQDIIQNPFSGKGKRPAAKPENDFVFKLWVQLAWEMGQEVTLPDCACAQGCKDALWSIEEYSETIYAAGQEKVKCYGKVTQKIKDENSRQATLVLLLFCKAKHCPIQHYVWACGLNPPDKPTF
jgi:hypothetical protein